MEKQSLTPSEQELAKKIIHLHDDLGLGFRKTVRKLASEGIHINKDKAHRLYKKYKAFETTNLIEDEELKQLKKEEHEAQEQLRLTKSKEETRRNIAALLVEEAMASFDRRWELFTNEEELLKFAEVIMPVAGPLVWIEFTEYCDEQGYDIANAVAIALGEQKYYEEHVKTDEKKSLDLYLAEQLKQALQAWKRKEEQCEQQTEKSEEETKEQISEGYTQYLDDEGFLNIQIPT